MYSSGSGELLSFHPFPTLPPPGQRSSLTLLWKEAATAHFLSKGSGMSGCLKLNLFPHANPLASLKGVQVPHPTPRNHASHLQALGGVFLTPFAPIIQFPKLTTCFPWEQGATFL